MTNRQLAESLVNKARGGYRPEEVVSLIVKGIERYASDQNRHIGDYLKGRLSSKPSVTNPG